MFSTSTFDGVRELTQLARFHNRDDALDAAETQVRSNFGEGKLGVLAEIAAIRAASEKRVKRLFIQGGRGKSGAQVASFIELVINEAFSTYQLMFSRDDTWLRDRVKAEFGAYDMDATPGEQVA